MKFVLPGSDNNSDDNSGENSVVRVAVRIADGTHWHGDRVVMEWVSATV